MIRILNWEKHFENNRSRVMSVMRWVPVPNHHDGEGFAKLMAQSNAAELFTAWILVLQVASKCKERGVLTREDGTPMNSETLALKTRGKKQWFDKGLPFFVEIGWSEWLQSGQQAGADDLLVSGRRVLTTQHEGDTLLSPHQQEGVNEGKGREGRERKEENGASAEAAVLPTDVVFAWNAISGFTSVRNVSGDRASSLKARLSEPFFLENWREALATAATLPFCHGRNNRNWRATFDWFIRPQTVAKILEGQYSDSQQEPEIPRSVEDMPEEFI